MRKSYFPTPTTVTSNIHQQTKQRTQERHVKSCCVCVALVSVVWRLGGYWMSWRLAFDSPPMNNKQPTTSQPTHNQPTANTHDAKTNKLPTAHPKADTGATHQVMICLCRFCVRWSWWILEVIVASVSAVCRGWPPPPNSGHMSDTSNISNIVHCFLVFRPRAKDQGPRNPCSSGPAGCAEHLNKCCLYMHKMQT